MNQPTIADIETLAQRAIEEIPESLRSAAGGIVFHVVDFPDDETMEVMGLETPFDILGLYHGVDLLHKSNLDSSPEVDRVFLYRRPLLDYWRKTGEPLDRLVRHVVIHEIGHHFGFSDADMEALEAAGSAE
jgi:predicted Zn-dependent protease with MMP-like domain